MIQFIKHLLIALGFVGSANAQDDGLKEIVINEILFNPVKDGYDYVEGYNRSGDTLDISGYSIANRNAEGEITNRKPLSRVSILIPPGKYFVITASEKWVRQQYKLNDSIVICQASMPSFADDEGTVAILKEDSITDELKYSEKWHFEMIAEPEGVSLERIHYDKPTQDKNNWISASSSSGFGTPGFQNSHFRTNNHVEGEVIIQPKVFTPNNDGSNDFVTITINKNESGWIANAVVYDIAGRRVKYLLKNETLAMKNTFNWYGLDDRSYPLPSGIYILFTELFSLQGETKRFKNTIIISNGEY